MTPSFATAFLAPQAIQHTGQTFRPTPAAPPPGCRAPTCCSAPAQNLTSAQPARAASLAAIRTAYATTNAAPASGACAHYLAAHAASDDVAARAALAALLGAPPRVTLAPSPRAAWALLSGALRGGTAAPALLAPGLHPAAAAAFPGAVPLPSATVSEVAPHVATQPAAVVMPVVDWDSGIVTGKEAIEAIRAFMEGSGVESPLVLDLSAAVGRVAVDFGALGAAFAVGDGAGLRAPSQPAFILAQPTALDRLAPVSGGDGVFLDVSLTVPRVDVDLATETDATTTAAAAAAPTPRRRTRRRGRAKAPPPPAWLDPSLWAPAPGRLEPGMPTLSAAAGLAAAARAVASVGGGPGLEAGVIADDARLGHALAAALDAVPGVRVLSGAGGGARVGIVGFALDGVVEGARAAALLARHGLSVEAARGAAVRAVLFAGVHDDAAVAAAAAAVRNACAEVRGEVAAGGGSSSASGQEAVASVGE